MALTRKERTLGCLWAMACGDALGVPSSFLTPEQIKSKYGWIDTFYPPEKGHIFHDGLLAGEYTDDTEQSMALMNAYIRDKKVVPMSVVKEIIAWADRVKDKYASPLGPSTERALKNIAAGGDITVSGKWGNTNGSSMRIAPLGIIHGLRGSTLQELARDVALTDLATHNTRVCNAAATAIAWGVAQAMRGEENLDKIVDATIEAAAEGAKYGFSIPSPDIGMRIALACDIVRKAKDDQQALHDLYAMFGGGDLSVRVEGVDGEGEVADLARTFNRMADNIQTNDNSRGQFMGNIAHELRTPMTTIKGFVDGILDGTIPPEMQNHYLQLVSEETGRLARLIQNMLDLSKLESGEYQVNARMFNIWETLTGVALSAEQRINDGMIDIDGLTMDEKVLVYADPDLIHQVAYNLLDNAIKFTPAGGTIRFGVERLGPEVEVSIWNSGQGISPEALPYVFQRFYKEDQSRGLHARGAGLGLNICKVLVNLSGGQIRVESKQGEWCRFVFTLPVQPPNPGGMKRLPDESGRPGAVEDPASMKPVD